MPEFLSSFGGTEYVSEGELRTHDHYALVFERGYGFHTNARGRDVFTFSRELFLEGYDVFIGEIAFSEDGEEVLGSRSIFVKRAS